MPTFRKIDSVEVELKPLPLSKRSQVAQEYDVYLDGFAAGDYGRAALIDGERRAVVRQRLQAAARRRGLALRFRSGPGPLTFHVMAALAISAPPLHEIVAATPLAALCSTSSRTPITPRAQSPAISK